MMNKIAFLCANPLESFLSPVFQSDVKSYYQRICNETLLREETLYCQERIEIYGETKTPEKRKMFQEPASSLQFLYVQSNQKDLLEEVFEMADLVIVGMPGSKKECDKIFLTILPWKEKTMFLWDTRICEEKFLKQIQREYGLKDAQMLEAKKLPPFLTEALNH